LLTERLVLPCRPRGSPSSLRVRGLRSSSLLRRSGPTDSAVGAGVRLALSLYLLVWMAIGAVAPHLHIAFSSHRHVYSAAHRQLEDAGPKLHKRELSPPVALGPQLLDDSEGTGSGRDETVACSWSNVNIGSASRVQSTPPLVVGLPHLSDATTAWFVLGTSSLRSWDLLLMSPKRCPPENGELSARSA
jgi:hypothetical protein